jgi:predicted RNase H-like HicB family nuclease
MNIMTKRKYPVILEKGKCNYGIYTANFPGCVSTGYTPEQTLNNMQEALQELLHWMKEDGDPIPEPSPVASVQFDPQTESVHEVEVEI